STFEVREDGDAYVLELRLSFAAPEDLDVHQLGDQLVVQVANQRSNYILPNFLNYYTMTEATLQDGWLHVRFTPDPESSSN
ncbi:MAG: arsenic-transporting ATPase, partial [Bacteroidetes bacterium QH_6_63_17]